MRWTMGRVLQTLLSNRPTLPCIQMSPIYFPAGVLYILFQREICFSSFDFEANVFLSVLWGQNIFQPLCSSYCCGREIYFCLNFEANIFVPAGVLVILFPREICCCFLSRLCCRQYLKMGYWELLCWKYQTSCQIHKATIALVWWGLRIFFWKTGTGRHG